MLAALSVIRNLGIIQCIQSILDDSTVNSNILLFMGESHDFSIPIITLGPDTHKKSVIFELLEKRRLSITTHVFSTAQKEMSWLNIVNFARLKRDTIFVNVSSGVINIAKFNKYDIDLEPLGSCDNTTALNESILTWLKSRKTWKHKEAIVCYSFDPPFTVNHTSSRKKGVVLDIYAMIHERIGIKSVFRKMVLEEESKETENRLLKLMNGRICDYFLQGMLGHIVNRYDFTTPSFTDGLYWYAPTPDLVPKWKYVYQVLTRTVWYFWISTLLVLALSWQLSTMVLERYTSIFKRLWDLYKLAIEQDGFSRPTNIPGVIIISCLILESFIMNIAYKCKFIEFLSTDTYENDLNTLEDAMEHNLNIGCLPLLKELFMQDEKLKDYLTDHYVTCDFGFGCIDRTAFSKDMIVLRAKSKLAYFGNRYIDAHGKFKLKKIGDIVSTLPFNSIFRRGHPLYPVVEKGLLDLLAHGFVEKISQDYAKDHNVAEEDPSSNQTLSLDHLRLSFIILLVGWVGGAILYFCEKMRFRSAVVRDKQRLLNNCCQSKVK